MKRLVFFTKVIASLVMAYFLASWWNSSAWSERYWTWINHVLGGQRPGLASDLELISTLSISLAVACALVFLPFRK